VDNQELAQLLGLEPLQQDFADRSGPRSRFYAQSGQGPSDLAKVAAANALREAGIGATDIDFLIFATMTPDVTFPGAGCYLQHKLGCGTIGALDLRAQCSGFLFALEIADQFVRAGAYRRVLVAAGDVHSSALDFSPSGVDVTPLFGDGAAACVVTESGAEIIEIVIHTDATDFDRFWCEFPSSRRRPTRFMTEDLARKRHHPTLDREFVQRDGCQRIRSTVTELLERSSTTLDRVAMFFLQHVYRGTALEAAEALRISNRATVGGLDEAHVASASLPIALSRARDCGAVKTGDLICLATAGAGMTSSAALLRL
jgi:3-oxoacyl-[acyl-carrier-protein] synthase-3